MSNQITPTHLIPLKVSCPLLDTWKTTWDHIHLNVNVYIHTHTRMHSWIHTDEGGEDWGNAKKAGSGWVGVFGAPKAKPGGPSVCTGSQDMEMISSKGCWLQPQVYQVKGGLDHWGGQQARQHMRASSPISNSIICIASTLVWACLPANLWPTATSKCIYTKDPPPLKPSPHYLPFPPLPSPSLTHLTIPSLLIYYLPSQISCTLSHAKVNLAIGCLGGLLT